MANELREYLFDAKALDLAEFVDRHGDVFLLRSSQDGTLSGASDMRESTKPAYHLPGTMRAMPRLSYEASTDPASTFWVYPVRKVRSGPDIGVTIGRIEQRDIWLPDDSVSALHAEIYREGGEYFIVDKASRNGTMVGTDQLEPGRAETLPLSVTIQVGRVRVRFVSAAELMDFVHTTV